MTYDAEYDDTLQDIECKDDPHDHDHGDLGKCPYNICQCDRTFARGLLENYKKCIQGVRSEMDFLDLTILLGRQVLLQWCMESGSKLEPKTMFRWKSYYSQWPMLWRLPKTYSIQWRPPYLLPWQCSPATRHVLNLNLVVHTFLIIVL